MLVLYLSSKVIKVHRKHQISWGNVGNEELIAVRGALSNAIEYMPISLLLRLYLEYNGASSWIIHTTGTTLIIGRIIHARGLLNTNFRQRMPGMQITVYVLIGLCLLNLVYLPLDKLMRLY